MEAISLLRADIPFTGETDSFKNLPYGTLFTVNGSDHVYCKTPFADMYEHNNNFDNESGGFCTAVIVNDVGYIQCCPSIECNIIDAAKLFGEAER